jgi:hypothetical protein
MIDAGVGGSTRPHGGLADHRIAASSAGSFDPTKVLMIVDAMSCEETSHLESILDGADLTVERMTYDVLQVIIPGSVVNYLEVVLVILRIPAGVDEAFIRDLTARQGDGESRTELTNFVRRECENVHIAVLRHEIGGNVDTIDFGGASPCVIAVMYRGAQTLDALLRCGIADVNSCTATGVSAVWVAAFQGDLSLCELLHAHGANLEAPRHDGETPRAVALRKGHQSIVRWFDEVTDSNGSESSRQVTDCDTNVITLSPRLICQYTC